MEFHLIFTKIKLFISLLGFWEIKVYVVLLSFIQSLEIETLFIAVGALDLIIFQQIITHFLFSKLLLNPIIKINLGLNWIESGLIHERLGSNIFSSVLNSCFIVIVETDIARIYLTIIAKIEKYLSCSFHHCKILKSFSSSTNSKEVVK